ncbi:MAG: MBL fold metallo-hydrolase [Alphaproteobacteria bacterium]|nr:MBL fold metallo-hydrolase [Alphaproteobacteria bacterium]
MRVTILGCGGAGGVPALSYGWGLCDPANPKNRRRRPAILVESGDTSILIDTPPDLREQLLDSGTRRLDAVLYSHEHADHVHGIDDLREINRIMRAPIHVHATPRAMAGIRARFAYAFSTHETGEFPIYKPWLIPHEIAGPFPVNGIEVTPFEQDHGYDMSSLGFRMGPVAYSTDVVNLNDAAFAALEGVRLWIVDCFTDREHATHAHLDKSLEWIARLKPERAILTHMSPRLDYEALKASIPAGIEPAYDGLTLEIPT